MIQKLVFILIIMFPVSCKVRGQAISKGDLRQIEIYYTPFDYCLRRPIQKNEIENICRYKLLVYDNYDFQKYDRFLSVMEKLNVSKDSEDEKKTDYRAKMIFHYVGYPKIVLYCSINKEIIFNGKVYHEEPSIIGLISLL